MLWKKFTKNVNTNSQGKTNKLQQQSRPWINTHSECGKWFSCQEHNVIFHARETNTDTEWRVQTTNTQIKVHN